MKAEKFSDALTNIDEKYIDEAIQYKGIKKPFVWQKWAAIAACLCIALGIAIGIISGITPVKYKRVSFNNNTLGGDWKNLLTVDTEVENTITADFPQKLTIYKIKPQKATTDHYSQLLQALNLPDRPAHLRIRDNTLDYALVDITDFSRGFFDMSEEDVVKLAWEYFEKIPFLHGEFECLGIRETTKVSDSKGEHISRVGVTFCRLLDGIRVSGEEKYVLYFDGSGLVGINVRLFTYEKTGTMDVIPLTDAAKRIKTPDDFSLESQQIKEKETIKTLHVDNIKLLLVNQHSNGCTILQPIYNFIGTATTGDGTTTQFQSRVIAIPDSYTYTDK